MLVDVLQGVSYLRDDVSDLFVRKWVVIELAHLHHAVEVHVE